MYTRIIFSPVVQRREVKTFCTKCGKKLRRVIKETYYRNGFHNEVETRRKNDSSLDRKKAQLENTGTVCGKCEGE
jgi:bacterioferritin-associated ferredoxin